MAPVWGSDGELLLDANGEPVMVDTAVEPPPQLVGGRGPDGELYYSPTRVLRLYGDVVTEEHAQAGPG